MTVRNTRHRVTWSPGHLVTALAVCALAATTRAQTAPAAAAPAPWSARDTAGGAVAVPAADKVSVLVFLRPDQPQTTTVIETLTARLKNRKDVQVIGIISGDDAGIGITKLAGKWPWPLVSDPDYAVSGKYSVRVWPTTTLIDKAGGQAAHIAGLPVSYDNDIDAYLDFASGKIDRAGLAKRLADRQVVADTADQKAARHVEVAQRLAAKGMKDDARAELGKALQLKPADPLVILTIARTDLEVGDANAAGTLLAALTDPALPHGELNLLKGWTALQLGKWDDARTILESAAKLNPEPAEAFYLLGVIAQHDNDLPKAAGYFRKAFEHTATGKVMMVAP